MSLSYFKKLGEGAFTSVYFLRRKQDSKIYSIKRTKMAILSEKEIEQVLNKIRILASLNHKNIIWYKDSFRHQRTSNLNIILEYTDDGDIKSKIKENRKRHLYFSENTIWNWVIQILEGIYYLNSNKIMHRDLKSDNIFLMKNDTLKLWNLGV